MVTKKAKTGGKVKRTSFKPGVSGNPKGRPVAELTFGHVLRTKLVSEYTSEEYAEAVAYIDAITDHMAKIASDKSTDPQVRLAYIKEIADRTEGKARQAVDVTSGGDKIGGLSADQAEQLLRARANRDAIEGDSD